MNATPALPEGPAVELAGAIERVGATKSDAFKYRLQPDYGQRGKAEGMTGYCKTVSGGPKDRGRTQEGKCELDAGTGHDTRTTEGSPAALKELHRARHAPLARLLLSQPSWRCHADFHEVVGLLQYPGVCMVDKPASETSQKVAVDHRARTAPGLRFGFANCR